MGLKNQISAYSDTNAALEQHIMAMRLKILEQFTESSPEPLSASDIDALEFSLEQNVGRPLRSLRNSKQPCNRIPSEIITRIAHYCSSPTFDTPWYVCLLRSTHLCHRWREVITSCPGLWAVIRLQPPKIASIFLERSGGFPLDIYTLSDSCCEPAHLSRTKTLRLRESGLDELAKTFSRLTVPSPIISEVIIEVTGFANGYFPDLPPLFGDTSTIRSLSLEALAFDTKLLRFTSLTSLNLDVFGELLPPFYGLLTANPALESLSISVWGAILEGEVAGPVIALNNLASLHCRDASKHLLSRLSLPRVTCIKIEDTGFPLALSRPLPTSITTIQCLARVHSLRLTTTTGVAYFGQTTDTHQVEFMGCGGSLSIHWVAGRSGPWEFDPQPLSLAHVKELSIIHQTTLQRPRASELDLSPLFNAMGSLEVLKIYSCLPNDSDCILSPLSNNQTCPFLHTVETFRCSRQTQWLSSLRCMAAQRRNAGLPLRKVLVLPHTGVNSSTQDCVEAIEELNSILTG